MFHLFDEQDCHGQGKLLENEFFPGQGKIGNFEDCQGNLEMSGKSQGNLKVNGYCNLQKLYIFCSRGKNILFC